MQKLIRFILGICILFLLVGCSDGIIHIEANSTGGCALGCKELMQSKYRCLEVGASYKDTYKNGVKEGSECECILMDCFKEIESGKQTN